MGAGKCIIWENTEIETYGTDRRESTEYIFELKKDIYLNEKCKIQYVVPRSLSDSEYQTLYTRRTTVFNDEDFLSEYSKVQRKNMERWTHYEIVSRAINRAPRFDVKEIKSFKNKLIPSILDRAFNVLDFFSSKIDSELGDFIKIEDNYIFLLECLSYSSTSVDELNSLPEILNYLSESEFIEICDENNGRADDVRMGVGFPEESSSNMKMFLRKYFLKLTIRGHEYVRERNSNLNLDSNKVFIAIWSNENFLNKCRNAFKKAVRSANKELEPYILADDYENSEKICEKALIEIEESSLVIVDLTCPQAEPSEEYIARGSVYFEAGYAKALKRSVIWTARENMRNHIHFDVEHYPILFWKNGEDLENKLRIRVEAKMPPRNSF